MAKYRILKTVKNCPNPLASWMEKPTDDDAVLAATALLRRGDTAEIWGETGLVGRIQRRPIRTRTGPKTRDVVAGLMMTVSAALAFMALHDNWLNAVSDPTHKLARSGDAPQAADAGYPMVADSASLPTSGPTAPTEAARPEDPAPAGGVRKVPRRTGEKPHLTAMQPAARTAVFPAVPQARTNIYGLMGAGFPPGGN